MEMFESVYDNYSAIYSELEGMMGIVYDELQKDPTNVDKSNMFQGLGHIALKVINSQMHLVDNYGESQYKDHLLSNLDNKAMMITEALNEDRNRSR